MTFGENVGFIFANMFKIKSFGKGGKNYRK